MSNNIKSTSLTPKWINDYAIVIGTRDQSLHPKQESE